MEENMIEIDRDLCDGCGLCVTVCPTGTISLIAGKAVVSGEESIFCGHCEAVCPQKAIRVTAIDEEMSRYTTFVSEQQWLPPGKFSTSVLVQLMASRRSCRCFTNKPVDRAMLEDLVKIGITAPSGTNSQSWTFTILPTRKAVTSFAEQIASYFKRLNTAAEKTMLRLFLKLIGKGELDAYFHSYYRKVKEALEEWHGSGKDRLFHGSTAAILVGSKPGASCPAEDALLATQNILLAAHSMGLGSCLIGYAVAAMKKEPSIQQSIGIPPEEEIHAVIALGYSDEVYQRTAGRKKVTPRYFEG
ncbi:MAG: 4Fe-4S dicluster domain-containing protein [Nitrospiraceae bacterium]|nr:MAG: 4Fe-4S dicluster domain-containing protein [Nitrospiraceae bacterium]